MRGAFLCAIAATSLCAQIPAPSPQQGGGGGGGGGSAVSINDFRVAAQNTNGAGCISSGNFDVSQSLTEANAGGTNCDAATNYLDGFIAFVSGSVTHVQFRTYLKSTFTGTIKALIGWNSTTTSGAAVFSLAYQCGGAGFLPTAAGYSAYTPFASSTVAGTASQLVVTAALSWTPTCAAGTWLYGDLELASDTLGGSPAQAQVKWLHLE